MGLGGSSALTVHQAILFTVHVLGILLGSIPWMMNTSVVTVANNHPDHLNTSNISPGHAEDWIDGSLPGFHRDIDNNTHVRHF